MFLVEVECLLAFLEEHNSCAREHMFCKRIQSFSGELNTFCERKVYQGNKILFAREKFLRGMQYFCERMLKILGGMQYFCKRIFTGQTH